MEQGVVQTQSKPKGRVSGNDHTLDCSDGREVEAESGSCWVQGVIRWTQQEYQKGLLDHVGIEKVCLDLVIDPANNRILDL